MTQSCSSQASCLGVPVRVHSMIVAAGVGSRFKSEIPKQLTPIFGKTVLEHSLSGLAKSHFIDHCLIVINALDTITPHLNFEIPVTFATGGSERWQSVQSGLQALIKAGAKEDELILIHDAARPTVPVEDINCVIQAAFCEEFGAILAAPVADTLKKASSNTSGHSYIEQTLDRSVIWQAQTPQVFRVGALLQALNHIAVSGIAITDEASAFEALNLPIRLVVGSRKNIKLTYPEDKIIIESILAS